ncbi:MAG: helix-turn-helix domain-containing protein [Cyclobacteriaceae bacterium]|jgi:isocitrate dehydrogenase kinase/phosphatase|nr:helix-turn-helix domain-containing protein [Cyclobacteriaceae bacterium]
MAANIITLEDLQDFKQELLTEFQKLLTQRQTTPTRKWLKSHEIRKLLGVSPGTLQTLRVNGTLPFTKIGGIIFYEYDDIQKMIEENKNNRDFPSRKNNPWRKV